MDRLLRQQAEYRRDEFELYARASFHQGQDILLESYASADRVEDQFHSSRDVLRQLETLPSEEHLDAWIEEFNKLADRLHTLLLELRTSERQKQEYDIQVETKIVGKAHHKGRPRIEVDQDTTEYLRNAGYKEKELREMASMKERTFRRRRAEVKEPPLTTEQVDVHVIKTKRNYPEYGYRMVHGHLKRENIKVSVNAVRESLWQVGNYLVQDLQPLIVPATVKKYRNPHPNAVWHFDGHEKLVSWKIWIHGCVDGYSHRIMWLGANNNKLAATVLAYFIRARTKFDTPLRIRCDKGKENKQTCREMHILRDGVVNNPVMTGRSVHNTRIERL
jgi:hypothetical protein